MENILLDNDKQLPKDIICHLGTFIETQDLGNFFRVSKAFNESTNKNFHFWFKKLLKDFDFYFHPDPSINRTRMVGVPIKIENRQIKSDSEVENANEQISSDDEEIDEKTIDYDFDVSDHDSDSEIETGDNNEYVYYDLQKQEKHTDYNSDSDNNDYDEYINSDIESQNANDYSENDNKESNKDDIEEYELIPEKFTLKNFFNKRRVPTKPDSESLDIISNLFNIKN